MTTSASDSGRELDVLLWGATGFTGRLVAEHLLARHGAAGSLRWALGGRNREKLERLRADLGTAAEALPLVVANADDEGALAEVVPRARVVCTTVGPYALYGSKLVAACARSGTHYCDLTGELPWMRRMIDAHQKEAEESGARIVHNCGFDCIPSDLGVFFLQREMQARHGVACARIRYRVLDFRGGFSGGTAASGMNMLAEAAADPAIRRLIADPYGLNPPGERGPDEPDRLTPAQEPDLGWTAPFVMAAINTRVVRRTNALLGHPWGREFRYDEAIVTGPGPTGFAKAAAVAAGQAAMAAGGGLGPVRGLLGRFLPEPGTGPSARQREQGFFDILLLGEHPTDPSKNLKGRVRGDRDPGYGSTSKMLGEAAVCLAQDALSVGGGFWTPAAAMGAPLLERLGAHAGVEFRIEAA